MTPVGFKGTITPSKQPQTHALERSATGIGSSKIYRTKISPNL